MPNGQIVKAINLSKDWARAVIDVPVPATSDINRVNEVLHQVGVEAFADRGLKKLLLDEPTVMGVESLTVDEVSVRVVARTSRVSSSRSVAHCACASPPRCDGRGSPSNRTFRRSGQRRARDDRRTPARTGPDSALLVPSRQDPRRPGADVDAGAVHPVGGAVHAVHVPQSRRRGGSGPVAPAVVPTREAPIQETTPPTSEFETTIESTTETATTTESTPEPTPEQTRPPDQSGDVDADAAVRDSQSVPASADHHAADHVFRPDDVGDTADGAMTRASLHLVTVR